MSNEITFSPRREIDLATLQLATQMAPIVHASRLFGGIASPEQAAIIMIKGYEIGLPMSAAFEFIQMIQGKPTLIPRGALALIHQSGQLADMTIEETANACTVTMRRRNGVTYTCSYSLDDAKRAGLIKQGGAWEMYPANMLRWRAIGFCADVVFPDVLAGMKRADELGAAVTAEGNVILEAEVISDG
jgi:hypothetical protein